MVRSVCSLALAGAVIALASGCSSFWQSDEEYRDEAISEQCDDPNCRECGVQASPARAAGTPRRQVAEAPAPADAGDPELAQMRAQIRNLQAEVARVRAQQSPTSPASDGSAVARLDAQMRDLQTQRATLDRRIAELEDQRRMIAGGARAPEPVSISKRSDPGDAALQSEEQRLRDTLRQYDSTSNR